MIVLINQRWAIIKQLILKIMQSKHNVSPLGCPILVFNNKLTKTSSFKHIRHDNKQNLIAFQSKKRLLPHLETNNQNSSLAVNVGRKFDLKSRSPLNSLQIQPKSNQLQKLSLRNNFMKSVQDKYSQASITSGRNKSVKFNDANLEMPSVQASLNLQKELTRKRSGSILKSSRVLSVRSSQELKSKSLKKYEQSKISNIFTINQYKNTLVRERYNQMLRAFHKNKENFTKMNAYQKLQLFKYTDSNFPPTSPSISKTKLDCEVSWVRLSQLYPEKSLMLFKNSQNISNVTAQQYGNQQFSTAIKLIGQSKALLNRIFQNSAFNQMGAYMLKIFHQHQWRCVIVDDYVPIFKKQRNRQPKFLFTSINSQQKDVEIWPLILEKAYASVIGSYQKLHSCDFMTYLIQMMGLPLSKIKIPAGKDYKKETQIFEKADILFGLNNSQNLYTLQRLIILAKYEKNQRGQQTIQLRHNSKNASYRINLKDLNRKVDELYFMKTASLQNCITTIIGKWFSIGKKIKSKRFFKQAQKNYNGFTHQKSIIKSFVVPSSDEIQFLLKFKQNTDKSLRESFWLRAILLMKQYNGYRWIEGKYSQNYISFSSYLQAGQYYLIIVPDWTEAYQRELFLITYSRINKIELKNHIEIGQQKMIEKGCADYAQRKGKLMQINKYICAYTIVDKEAGLIIQNINNERRGGPIKIFRNIQNLKPQESFLLPYNKEFYNNGTSMNNQIAVSVQKEQSYSVILMQFGGNDKKFMESFSFGP